MKKGRKINKLWACTIYIPNRIITHSQPCTQSSPETARGEDPRNRDVCSVASQEAKTTSGGQWPGLGI